MVYKKGLKLLTRQNKKLYSWNFPCGASIRYFINKSNRPKKDCGPLALFDSVDVVLRECAASRDTSVVYLCKYIESDRKELHDRHGWCNCFTPKETRFAEEIILIKRLPWEEVLTMKGVKYD